MEGIVEAAVADGAALEVRAAGAEQPVESEAAYATEENADEALKMKARVATGRKTADVTAPGFAAAGLGLVWANAAAVVWTKGSSVQVFARG